MAARKKKTTRKKSKKKKSTRSRKKKRDVTKAVPAKRFVAKLRRLADSIEQGKRFRIQVAGERVSVPSDAEISVEHERGARQEELEFQITWKVDG